MKNAHERFGWLEFEKQLKDTRTRIRVALDRFISEPSKNEEASGTCHLISVFGSDVDIGAIWAGLAGQEWLSVCGPDLTQRRVTLGKDPRVFRGTIAVAGRSRRVRHLVALSSQLADEADVGRIILCNDDADIVLYRIWQRLGLPVHPSWAKWFWSALQEKNRIQPLDGLAYRPIAVVGTKEEFLQWIAEAVREKAIEIPDVGGSIPWQSVSSARLS